MRCSALPSSFSLVECVGEGQIAKLLPNCKFLQFQVTCIINSWFLLLEVAAEYLASTVQNSCRIYIYIYIYIYIFFFFFFFFFYLFIYLFIFFFGGGGGGGASLTVKMCILGTNF